MSDDPKKTVDDLIDRLVEEALALTDEELEVELQEETAADESAAKEGGSEGVAEPEDRASATAPNRKGRAKAAATTRSTSGVAYEFEDHVAASYMVRAMAGLPMPASETAAVRLQFQTQALDWSVDDLLMLGEGADQPAQLAISCKSNLQVGPGGFPAEFARAVWADWDRIDSAHRQSVLFALATRGKHDAFEKTWTDIKDWLGKGVTPLAIARIHQSAQHKRIFDSVRLDDTRTDAETGELVRRLLLISTDFQLDNSQDEESAIERCRSLLVSGEWQQARALWESLLDAARDARTNNGEIEVARLWADLRVQFELRDHPDLAASWETLRQITEDSRDRVVIALPNGHMLTRAVERQELRALLQREVFSGVLGESGVGKSALVAVTLDEAFPDWSQTWLRAEDLEVTLSPTGRQTTGMRHELQRTLLGSSKPRNVLVVDAGERLSEETLPRARRLIEALLASNLGETPAWRVVIVSQSEAGAGVRSGLGLKPEAQLAVTEPTVQQVKQALMSSERLRWLASHDDAVSVLRNLKTLAFVMQAESAFPAQGPQAFSRSAIADALWSWWTSDSASMAGLLIRLSERDASFQRSVGVSELEPAHADAFDKRTLRTPLRINRLKRIEFAHDLAADWSRYQKLREIAFETEKWAPLAENPIWLPALRMLGEFLLRESLGDEVAWDVAFRTLEGRADFQAARDVLLDALCLDPLAGRFLTARADALFADQGALLLRLLQRFLHVATVAAVPPHILALDPTLLLLWEAQHRAPIIGRWFGMVQFLDSRREDVACLMSTSVARLCEIWLTSVPPSLEGMDAVPLRQELSGLALATARALQVAQGTHRYILQSEIEQPIYKAAFAGSVDRPDEVAGWALEMCGRREPSAAVQAAIAEFHRKDAQARAERLRTDPAYRRQQERKRAMREIPHFFDHPLPPWPLGPQDQLEHDFRNACLHKNGLNELMKVRPVEAGEILLACIIDDAPKDRSQDRFEPYLGLAYDNEAYPTIYWSSPFLMFLWSNADQALTELLKLLAFCTERWAEPADGKVYQVEIELAAGDVARFTGNNRVFEWVEAESSGSGQLFCALAALEFWLCAQLDADQDMDAVLRRLLSQSRSAAILGVLVNVGKHKPDLFKGLLRPLLSARELYRWDDYRVRDKKGYRFNAMHWARSGDRVFEMAKAWAFAPRHEISLSQVAHQLMLFDEDVAEHLKHAVRQWPAPADEKDRLELAMLAAQLDRDNYVEGEDGALTLIMPEALERDIDAFNVAHAPKLQAITLPIQCLNFLGTGNMLSDADCGRLAQVLLADVEQGEIEDGDEARNSARSALIAAAGTLLARGRDFLRSNPVALQRAQDVIRDVVAQIGEDLESLRNARHAFGTYDFLFVAYAAAECWRQEPRSEWRRAVLRLISSRHSGVVGTIVRAFRDAEGNLSALGRNVKNAALLWSALSALSPRYNADPSQGARWESWVRRFRELPLDELADVKINLSDLAERVERLADIREEHSGERRGRRRSGRQLRTGLDNEVLAQVYQDVLNHERKGDIDTADDRWAALALWELYCRTLEEDADEDGEYGLTDRVGYDVVSALARMAGHGPENETQPLWRGVLALGPKGHRTVAYFLGLWFLHPDRGVDRDRFVRTWRQMIEFIVTEPVWNGDKLWYRREHALRQVLGFGSDRPLASLPNAPAAIAGMWDLYEAWAARHLDVDEDNLTGFAYFLSSDVARDVRLRGCTLLATHVAKYTDRTVWRRDRAGASLVDLAETILTHHADAVKSDQVVRDALLKIVAALAAKNTTGALILQERIRDLK